MAKNSTPVVVVRSSKPKTAAQLAKRADNIFAASQRLKALQAQQKLAKELRALGYVGTDELIVAQFNRDRELKEADAYVKAVLAVPKAGQKIQRWLKSRITMAPIHLKELILNFLNRDGRNGDHDNSDLKAAVESHLMEQTDLKIAA